jgi:hypothetical protein
MSYFTAPDAADINCLVKVADVAKRSVGTFLFWEKFRCFKKSVKAAIQGFR